MARKFTPSQNILISKFDVAEYIVTPNVQEVFDSIVNSYNSGLRSVNLIGAYGTGKSSFLNALEYHLTREKIFVEGRPWTRYYDFETLKLVGAYDSIVESVRRLLNSPSAQPSLLLEDLEERIKSANGKKKVFLLVIDEFGKFLEFASLHQAEKELYFLQQVAELVNNSSYEAAFITTLHQDFSAYAVSLNTLRRNEWSKVSGRFKEITFNEPVEQLLFLASKKIAARPSAEIKREISRLRETIGLANAFPLRSYFDTRTAERIFPLDLLSASVLSLALQQYGQNERSLFTFLNSDSRYSLCEFEKSHRAFYSVADVYDYLHYSLYSFLNSKGNIHYTKWAEIKNSLERVEGEVTRERHRLYQTVIKTIGLLNIFSHNGAKLDREFLTGYIERAGRLTGVAEALEDLNSRNIISFNKYSNRFFYSETTIVDIDVAIKEAGLEITRSRNIIEFLGGNFPLAPISAKRAYYEKGTPRVFEFKISEFPYASSSPSGPVDGFINLIFNSSIEEAEIMRASTHNPDAILYGHFLKVDEILHSICEIEKAEIAKAKYPNDKVIQRELSAVIDIQRNLLNYYVYQGFYHTGSVKWYYRGEIQRFSNSKELNSFLSKIIDDFYPFTPVFRSELGNRTRLSAAISTARRLLLESIFQSVSEKGLAISGFPPHKSIYLSLLSKTGIHKELDGKWALAELTDSSDDPCRFIPLFQACNQFVSSTKGAKRHIGELYEVLGQAPFKLKTGFLDFWIPIYLIIKSEEFAMYGQNGFIPQIDSEVLELLVKNPRNYSIKAFDTDGIKIQLFNQYRDLLALSTASQTSNEGFIKTIVPFFKFYKDLKPYVKNTKRLSKKTLKVRNALTNATDPEKFFFEDLPAALGYDTVQLNKQPKLLEKFRDELQESIRELRSAFESLQSKFELIINSLWGRDYSFAEYKEQLRMRYQGSLKSYLLLPAQRTFYDRLCSPLDDRTAWLSSISQSLLGKTLENLSDTEVERLQEKFLHQIHELDNLNEIALQTVDLESEVVFKIEVTAPGNSLGHKLIRFPKKSERVSYFENEVASIIENEDRVTKIAILAQLLKKELEKDGK